LLTTRLRNHFRFAGTTIHGANSVDVSLSINSKVPMYCGHRCRLLLSLLENFHCFAGSGPYPSRALERASGGAFERLKARAAERACSGIRLSGNER
jgi:hypothetical protein